MSSTTCSPRVGLGFPDRLALGAAILTPAAFIRLHAILLFGNLTATVSSPPVVPFGTLSLLLNIKVIGPGQKASINFFATSGTSVTKSSNIDTSAIWAISGLSEGLPFA